MQGFIRRTLLLVSLFLLASEAAGAEKPNIVFILFDDMGYGQPTCYRKGSEFKTPNLDRLAREGMRFTDAHTSAAVCTPTRYGVLTGRYPSRIGQYGVLTTFSKPIIPRSRLTVAALLKEQGYHTACIGKWHLGMGWGAGRPKNENAVLVGTPVRNGPTALGFDVFHGYTHARNIGMILEQDKVAVNVKPVGTQPLLAKQAVAYIDDRAKAKEPFFLYLPLCPPHTPIVPAPEFVGKSGAQNYGDWLYQGDWVTGQVLDALDRHRLSENTLVIVTSDNGAAGRVYAPLRGCKTSIYEGGHRVPFLAWWPGKIRPGSVCKDTVCLNDLMATAAEIVGAKLPENAGEDSVSILPDLLGIAKAPVREATVHQSPKRDLAIRQGPWKLIFLHKRKRELYNLESDIGETQNLVAKNPEVVDRLDKLMQKYIANGRSTPGPAQKNEATISLDTKSRPMGEKAKEEKNARDPSFD